MRILLAIALLATSAPVSANDWQRFYVPVIDVRGLTPQKVEPEVIAFNGDADALIDRMWDDGYVMIGYTVFETGNASTRDGVKLAKKLSAPRVAIGTDLTSSSTGALPLTLPKTTSSYTSGSVTGPAGTANFGATTTTTGTQTTFVPYTINRFTKVGVYFHRAPQLGLGVLTRAPTAEIIAQHETRRLQVVRSVRRGSPSYSADVLPGDIILRLNGQPADDSAMTTFYLTPGAKTATLDISRAGRPRQIVVNIPSEWSPPAQ